MGSDRCPGGGRGEVGDFRGTDPSRGEGRGLALRLRQPVVPAAKATLRRWGQLTAGHRTLPDFLVIGAKRGGSTSLQRNLLRTPGVLALFPRREDLKGSYYFDVHHERGERWYRSHFPTTSRRRRAAASGPVAVGEASPYYLSHPWAAERAAALVPGAAVVALLRDPVERAHSHYRERVKQGIEGLPTFAEAVEAEPARLRGEVERMLEEPGYVSWNHLNFGYLAQSDYAPALARWRAHFPPEQVLVLRSEDFYADDVAVLAEVRAFLGLRPAPPSEVRHYNRLPAPSLDPGLERELRARMAPGVRQLEAELGWPTGWPTAGSVAASSR